MVRSRWLALRRAGPSGRARRRSGSGGCAARGRAWPGIRPSPGWRRGWPPAPLPAKRAGASVPARSLRAGPPPLPAPGHLVDFADARRRDRDRLSRCRVPRRRAAGCRTARDAVRQQRGQADTGQQRRAQAPGVQHDAFQRGGADGRLRHADDDGPAITRDARVGAGQLVALEIDGARPRLPAPRRASAAPATGRADLATRLSWSFERATIEPEAR